MNRSHTAKVDVIGTVGTGKSSRDLKLQSVSEQLNANSYTKLIPESSIAASNVIDELSPLFREETD